MKLVQRNDDKKAIILHGYLGVEEISYSSFQEQVSLKSKKYIPNEIVGFCDKISLDLILEYFAAIEAGAIPCFVAHPSAKVSKDIFDYRVNNLQNLGITKIISKEYRHFCSDKQTVVDNNLDILFIQTSSGTTNNQKAFCISKTKLFNQIDAYSRRIGFNKESTSVSWLPVYHDMGLFTSLFMPLMLGATSVIIPTFDWVAQNDLLFKCIDAYGGTHCWLPDFAFSLMGNKEFELNNKDCKFFNCSEVCKKKSIEKFVEKYSDNIYCTYAMAENVFAVATSEKIDISKEGDILDSGKPIEGTSTKIEDENIVISGSCLFDALLRACSFEKNEAIEYNTKDVCKEKFRVLGRTVDFAKIFGKQINLLDVDSCINEKGLCHLGRCVSFELNGALVVLYEGDENKNNEILMLIRSIFDVAGIVNKVNAQKLIKTSSGKLSRELNKKLYEKRVFVRQYIENELKLKGVPYNANLKASGHFDSFSIMEMWTNINMKLNQPIDWSIDFASLETVEDFVNVI